MGYYVRFLATTDKNVPLIQIEKYLKVNRIGVYLEIEDGDENDWYQAAVKNKKKEVIAIMEKNPVKEGLLGEEEIEEFLEDVEEYKPESAVNWLKEYLPTVKVIYAFQILNPIHDGDGWQIVDTIKEKLWNELGGIFQADMEGFSNTDGYHILWQFSDNVDGEWCMAILDGNEWIKFTMDLGNAQHKIAFQEGRIPEDVEIMK
ncbi:MAG: hypothetical protein H6638_01545 [Ardenticatenales bacterium]|nr:hypothetical protein [Ardenticatenales bacterium]MCB9172485.1 hypothetical protein [Ardenticatenales bacterium]